MICKEPKGNCKAASQEPRRELRSCHAGRNAGGHLIRAVCTVAESATSFIVRVILVMEILARAPSYGTVSNQKSKMHAKKRKTKDYRTLLVPSQLNLLVHHSRSVSGRLDIATHPPLACSPGPGRAFNLRFNNECRTAASRERGAEEAVGRADAGNCSDSKANPSDCEAHICTYKNLAA